MEIIPIQKYGNNLTKNNALTITIIIWNKCVKIRIGKNLKKENYTFQQIKIQFNFSTSEIFSQSPSVLLLLLGVSTLIVDSFLFNFTLLSTILISFFSTLFLGDSCLNNIFSPIGFLNFPLSFSIFFSLSYCSRSFICCSSVNSISEAKSSEIKSYCNILS